MEESDAQGYTILEQAENDFINITAFRGEDSDEKQESPEDVSPEIMLSKQSCFNDNYLVFSLKGIKLPQITDIYIDQEEDMLDCQQIIKFSTQTTQMPSSSATAQGQRQNEAKDGLAEYVEQDYELMKDYGTVKAVPTCS